MIAGAAGSLGIGAAYSADEGADCPPSACVEIGAWQFALGVGVGVRSNPLNDGDAIPLVLLPQVRYYGERFFLENLEAGWTISEGRNLMVNALVTPSYDGVFFNRWDPGNVFVDVFANTDSVASEGGQAPTDDVDAQTEVRASELSKRRFSYLGGLEFSYDLQHGMIQALFLSEITGRHSGKEIRFAYQHPLTPRVSATLGFTWKDKKLTDYYYGIDRDEVGDDRAEYRPSASFNPFIRLSARSPGAGKGWRLGLEWQRLDTEITRSPIVDDDDVITVFLGRQIVF